MNRIYSKLAPVYMEQDTVVLEAASKTQLGLFTPKIDKQTKP
jgi:hypothetical protein